MTTYDLTSDPYGALTPQNERHEPHDNKGVIVMCWRCGQVITETNPVVGSRMCCQECDHWLTINKIPNDRETLVEYGGCGHPTASEELPKAPSAEALF